MPIDLQQEQAFVAAKAWLEDAGEYRAKTGKICSIRTDLAAQYMVKAMSPVHVSA
jgi:hypothetical protein